MRTILLSMVVAAICIRPVSAQQPQTRWGVTTTVGTESGLGYHLPYVDLGAGVEHAIRDRMEVQASANYSPTHKYITNDGNSVHLGGRALLWVNDTFALTAGDGETWLRTSQFDKANNFPQFGVAARLWWLGFPSRFYAAYLVPEGKRPTDGSLQSNRLQGISTAIEAQGWSRVRLTTTFNVLTFLEQSGAAPGKRDWTGTVVVTIRVGTKQDLNELY